MHHCVSFGIVAALVTAAACKDSRPATPHDSGRPADASTTLNDPTIEAATRLIIEGRQTFRYDTFGDEAFWGDALRLHEAIATVSPKTALAVGLKVDAAALPATLVDQIKAGKVDLDSPATTLAVLKLNAVVGVTGIFDGDHLKSIGIQCALCHSTVDDSFGPGIGQRLT